MSPRIKTKMFKDQAATYLVDGQARKKRPFRPETIATYESLLRTTILPEIGKFPLQRIGNKVLKDFVQKLHGRGASPATIALNTTLIKQIVGSAIDENGESLHPRKWNSSFIDSPAIENQKQPTIALETLQEAFLQAAPDIQALIAVLAGTGLRINEALALWKGADMSLATPYNNSWLPEQQKLIIHGQRSKNSAEPTKTKAGVREVDLHPDLNEFLKKSLTSVKENDILFPLSEGTYRNQFRTVGIETGFHSLRRFRETHMAKMNVPEMLRKFWTGHAAKDVTERYIKMGSEIETRKTEALRAGVGFELETHDSI